MKRNGLFALCLAALMTVTGCVSTSEIHTSGVSAERSGVSAERIEEFRRAINEANTIKIARMIGKSKSSPKENIARLIGKSSPEENVEGLLLATGSSSGIVSIFLDAGIDVNSVGSGGRTPLMTACESGADATVQLLLEKGADVNSVNSNGNTPLMHACAHMNNSWIVRLLLEKGADINRVNNKGETALFIAIDNGYSELISILRDAGAKLSEKERQSYVNFRAEVVLRKGEPIKAGDKFTVEKGKIEVMDRVTNRSGYTYLVTIDSSVAGYYCFYILSQREIALKNSSSYYSYRGYEYRYITSANDLKLTCTGIGKYQRNYQDVDCYIFTLDEEL